MNYGMPYKGSKSKIAEWLIEQLPKAKHFYDLFGGGWCDKSLCRIKWKIRSSALQ